MAEKKMETNISVVTPTKLVELIEALVKRPAKYLKPLMIWGDFGIGKSAMIAQICEKYNWLLVDIRLSQHAPEDVHGIPFPINDDGVMRLKLSDPIIFPNEMVKNHAKYEKIILFLDELNQASANVMKACFQLLNDRRTGHYKLPDNVYLVCAGNIRSSLVEELNPGICNRMMHTELKPDWKDWVEYIENEADWHPTIPAFHRLYKGASMMMPLDIVEQNSLKAFPTPRTWEMVNYALKYNNNDNLMRYEIQSAIGLETANKFFNLFKMRKAFKTVEEIVEGKFKKTADLSDPQNMMMAEHLVIPEVLSYISKESEPICRKMISECEKALTGKGTALSQENLDKAVGDYLRVNKQIAVKLHSGQINLINYLSGVFDNPDKAEMVAAHISAAQRGCWRFESTTSLGKYRIPMLWKAARDVDYGLNNTARPIMDGIVDRVKRFNVYELSGVNADKVA